MANKPREAKVTMKHFTARMPEEVLVKIKIRAAIERTSIQEIVERACRLYLKTSLKRPEDER
jgi:hypothetical protein